MKDLIMFYVVGPYVTHVGMNVSPATFALWALGTVFLEFAPEPVRTFGARIVLRLWHGLRHS